MIPDVGDIAWVELGPVKGSEQDGRRPVLFLSDATYHSASRRAVICPITTRARPWPFNVSIPSGLRTTGVVLVDQVRTIDRPERMFDLIERAPDDLLAEVRGRLAALLGFDAAASIVGPGDLTDT
jgi:mRNA interferase MazF